ncbi:hypothetical protein BDN72DRAFT_193431 [Pluteus cervinus]|uniref:Uncharacterized protein n=1 Tax=Pluteus cervinus TaxID=181527 RepID=A0ACD3AII8_9AGAR|nr:hypothetical protein BDN72DRAFT_193431 [Pluteus cervinus]
MASPSQRRAAIEPAGGEKRKQEPPVEEPAAKRVKTAANNFQRHTIFWYDDGSVFLQFGTTRMKLYRQRLALNSVWFKELFQKSDELGVPIDVVDGLKLFYLEPTGVSLTDFEALLIAMEDGIEYSFSKPTFPVLASIIRAASALNFPKYLSFATTVLECSLPDKLDKVTKKPVPYAADAIVFARTQGLQQLLKRAFYDLARTESFENSATEKHPVHKLDPADLVRLLCLQKRLTVAWLQAVAPPPINCIKSGCSVKAFMVPSAVVQEYYLDPICGIGELRKWNWAEKGHCVHCQDARPRWLREQQMTCWKNIDELLDLGDE